jgi:hypothetical protein
MPRTAKTKKKPSEKEVGGDGFEAILLVTVNDTTSSNLPNKRQRRATVKSKIAGSVTANIGSAIDPIQDEKAVHRIRSIWCRFHVELKLYGFVPFILFCFPFRMNSLSIHNYCY